MATPRAALALIEPHADRPRTIPLEADKAFDAQDFVKSAAGHEGHAECGA
jgi:hypothetical protein